MHKIVELLHLPDNLLAWAMLVMLLNTGLKYMDGKIRGF